MIVLWRAALGLLLASAVAGSTSAATPVKLAVFAFELDDFSAALAPDPADSATLARVTDDVRKVLKDSGRYELVAVAGVAVKTLRDCNGCDAALAKQAGAQQSLVGVVKRISRTEYQVHFQLRDAQTGAVIAEADTGLRMGARDSWNRGAMRLVKDRLLKNPG